MIYSLSLQTVGFVLGALLVASHAVALINATEIRKLLALFPRSKAAGMVLLTVAALWTLALVAKMDLGEFSQYRSLILGATVVSYFLTLKYVDEFLAVRALGMILLLAVEPVLESAFLRPEPSRLLLTVLAYGWAVMGLIWVGMPYKLRDLISFMSKTEGRWKVAAWGGVIYGGAILFCAWTQWS